MVRVLFRKVQKKINKNKKMQVYQQFDVDIVPACNFILKKRLRHMCFTASFTKLLKTIILENIGEGMLLMI